MSAKEACSRQSGAAPKPVNPFVASAASVVSRSRQKPSSPPSLVYSASSVGGGPAANASSRVVTMLKAFAPRPSARSSKVVSALPDTGALRAIEASTASREAAAARALRRTVNTY